MNRYKILEIDPIMEHFAHDIELRMNNYQQTKKRLLGRKKLSDFANGFEYYGFHQEGDGWYYREWAPNAESVSLYGDFNCWNRESHKLSRLEGGNWQLFCEGKLPHSSLVKTLVTANGRTFERIPLYAKRAVQDYTNFTFCGQIWQEDFKWTDKDFSAPETPLIYEAHIGMSGEGYGVSTFEEFCKNVLPRVKKAGYNTIQLMAVMEHPYYASFGYQVSNFFAVSSRFGTPEELKKLINTAHKNGIAVYLDLVHSHAAKNTCEGINEFDGTDYQFFHSGGRGEHSAWNTKLFDYGKPEVLHFLLSNLKYWLLEYHLDGFRFDGVTSMLYHHHGLGVAFDNYGKYFSMDTDTDAVTYLQLANELIHKLKPEAVTIAEDMSGMPGMCLPIKDGGIGFDYRLSMGVPDFWINTLKTVSDENWNMDKLWYELTTRRPKEKTIGYAESHDQALVGDKTIMFWLADADMYHSMSKSSQNYKIDRAIALHKLIRLVTFSLAGEGYMNFMGNEFGHPEWIDFPREGNNDSYHYARRQWSLADNPELKFKYLLNFDRDMLKLQDGTGLLNAKGGAKLIKIHNDDKLLCYQKGRLLFLFNFNPVSGFTIETDAAKLPSLVMDTDHAEYGGFGPRNSFSYDKKTKTLSVTVASRTAMVFLLDTK